MTVSNPITIDAPIGGWDSFNSLDNMPPENAVILDNLIPGAGSVDTRGGSVLYADTGTGLPVETVASIDTAKTSLLVVASGGGFWDITDNAAIVEIAAAGTFTNDRWQTSNFRKLDEEGVLILTNGIDNAQKFESPYTAMADLVVTGPAAAPISSTFIGSEAFKGRVYYWLPDSDAFWYSQAGSYQGELNEFNLGTIAQRGGNIVLITTWTQQDSGDGKDDFLVFVMSTGEILVYQGDDPQGVGFFEMVGRYTTAEPLSIRGNDQYGADTVIMTKDGYITLSTIIQQGRVSDVPAFSRLITGAIQDRTRFKSQFYGWDTALFSEQGLFVFNVPLSEETFEQHVLNTVTMRWCRFKDLNVNCINIHKDRLFGGLADGTVIALLEGTSDRGAAIQFTALPAFNYFGNQGVQKHITAAQVISTHQNPELIQLTGLADFNFPLLSPLQIPATKGSATWSIDPPSPPAALGSFWNEDFWSVEDTEITTKGWQNVSAFGFAVSVMVRFVKVNESVRWRSTGIRYINTGAQ